MTEQPKPEASLSDKTKEFVKDLLAKEKAEKDAHEKAEKEKEEKKKVKTDTSEAEKILEEIVKHLHAEAKTDPKEFKDFSLAQQAKMLLVIKAKQGEATPEKPAEAPLDKTGTPATGGVAPPAATTPAAPKTLAELNARAAFVGDFMQQNSLLTRAQRWRQGEATPPPPKKG